MKKVIAILTVIMMVCVLFAGCNKDEEATTLSNIVSIKDSLANVEVDFEAGMTVAQLLEKAGVSITERDKVTPAADTVLEEPVEIFIERYAKVNVNVNGEIIEVELVGGTVADALEAAGVKVDDTVKANFDLNAALITVDADIVVEGAETPTTDENAATEATTTEEEATTAARETTESSDNNYYYEDDDDDDNNYYSNTTTTTRAPVTDPPTYVNPNEDETAPPVVDDPIVTDPPEVDTPTVNNGGSSGEREYVRTETVNDCDGSGNGYYIHWYSDGSYEIETFVAG